MTSAAQPSDRLLFDPTAPLKPSGNLRRRLIGSQLVRGAAIAAALLAVGALVIVTFDVVKEGAGALNLDFIIKDPPAFGSGGGIRSAIIGTAIIAGAGALIATPLGILIALYLVEFSAPRSRTAAALRMALDLMQGVPAIVVGVFVLGLIVEVQHKDSGFAGSMALAIIMLPLVARSSQEVLLLVPGTLREASDALGVDRWRSIVTVILPTAMSGILTGAILALARAAGETAPLLAVDGTFTPHLTFNWFGPMPNIPVSIWTAAEAADPNGFTRAWGMAFVLLMLILLANVGARILLARSRRKAMG